MTRGSIQSLTSFNLLPTKKTAILILLRNTIQNLTREHEAGVKPHPKVEEDRSHVDNATQQARRLVKALILDVLKWRKLIKQNCFVLLKCLGATT